MVVTAPALAQQQQQAQRDPVMEKDFKAAVDAFNAGDNESAWFLFWSLAQGGDEKSQFNLAQMYRLGKGIPVDLGLAKRWYEAAAAKDHTTAQYLLGVMYENGHGVPKDINRARNWYQRAANLNYGPAKEALEQLGSAPRTAGR
jgi:TPR repeat protein